MKHSFYTFPKKSRVQDASKKKLLEQNLKVSQKTIINIINCKGKNRNLKVLGREIPKRLNKRKVRTRSLIHKVDIETNKPNPKSQNQLAKECNTSQQIINLIIHKDLNKKTRRKTKVHRLNQDQKATRKTTCRKMYEQHLSGPKYEYFVTLDEAWIYLSYCNGNRKICYVESGKNPPENWMKYSTESWPKGFMVVGVMTGRGVIPLFRVPPKVKINADYYITYILKPLFEKFLPEKYPGELHKIFFHHDKASSHTSRKTLEFLNEMKAKHKINFISNKDIPVKSPDASLCDFFGFGWLKQQLLRRKATTLEGLWKLSRDIWHTFPLETVQKAFNSWKMRCRLIDQKNGDHIEQIRNLHRRTIL